MNRRDASSPSPSPTLPKASVSTALAAGNNCRSIVATAGTRVEPPVRISVSIAGLPIPAAASVCPMALLIDPVAPSRASVRFRVLPI